jgi:ubiquinone/menaquinone biosynthesis C-methylase UbiE
MELSVAIRLIEKGVVHSGEPQEWADLGSGSGLFTRALSTLLPASSLIHAVDQDEKALSTLRKENSTGRVRTHIMNFERDTLPFSSLDGILLANALHFVEDQKGFLTKVGSHLKPNGKLILIEYDLPEPNPWVPYPIRFSRLQSIIELSGFRQVQKLAEAPSRFNASMIYSCLIL